MLIAVAVSGLISADGLQEAHAQSQPVNVTATGSLGDNNALLLGGANGVDVFTMGGKTYAAIVSRVDDGLQIVDVSNPASPGAVGQLSDTDSLLLDGARAVDVFKIGANTYAAVASSDDDGLQIVDVSDPASPDAVGQLNDTDSLLDGAHDVDVFTIGANTYAAVASNEDDALQLVDVTDPASPAAAGNLNDTGSRELGGAFGVAVFKIGDNTYAAVSSYNDDGLQIVDVTNPASPVAVGRLADGALLFGARYVDTFTITDGSGINTYAVVTIEHSDGEGGLQLVDITDPTMPTAAGRLLTDGSSLFNLPEGVTVFKIGQSTYAAVASDDSDGIQIVDVSDPAAPAVAGHLRDGGDLKLAGSWDVDVFTINGRTYAAVASNRDGLQLMRLEDSTPPAFESATLDRYAGTMTVTFSEAIDVSETDLSMLYVSDDGQTNAVSLAGADFDDTAADSETIWLILTPAQLAAIVPMDTPQLDIAAGAASDLSENLIDAAADNPITTASPDSPIPSGRLAHDSTLLLDFPRGMDTFRIGEDIYAAVTYNGGTNSGLQTINVTDPASPTAVGKIKSRTAFFGDTPIFLSTAQEVDIFTIGNNTYAAVVAFRSEALQIINVTDPSSLVEAGHLSNSGSDVRLSGATDVGIFTIGSSTYAAVASFSDNTLQIVNVTDPDNPAAAGQLTDTDDLLLNQASDVAIFTIGSSTYAAVTSSFDDGLQIVNVTDPDDPVAAGNLADTTSLQLRDATAVDVFTIDDSTYAAVTTFGNEGLQIVNVTDPDNPAAAGNLADTDDLLLDGPRDVTVLTIGSSTYAVAPSANDGGLQIVNVTDPDNPAAAGNLPDTDDLLLDSTRGVAVFMIGGSPYAAVSADTEGIQIVKLGEVIDMTSNSLPVAPAEMAITLEDTPITITPNISDPDTSDTPAISTVSDPPNGTATHDDTTIIYTPDQDYDGTDTFSYTVTDGTDTTQGTVTVTVVRGNNDPVLGTIGDRAATVGVQLTITPTVTDADTTDTHTYSITRGTLPAAAVFSTSDGSITWTPVQADAGQTHEVTITVNDGRGGTDSETFDIVAAEVDTTPLISATPAGQLRDGGPRLLTTATSLDVFTIGDKTYAAVASYGDDALQIINVTDPDSPSAAGHLADTNSLRLDGAYGVDVFTIDDKTYAAVASHGDDALQIVNVTDSDNPEASGSVEDTEPAGGIDDELLLEKSRGVAVFVIGDKTYAAVTSSRDRGLQIINVTDPDNPAPAGQLKDTAGAGGLLLAGPWGVDVFTVGGSTYAAVASFADNGLQIVDVTDPDNPAPAGQLKDTAGAGGLLLAGSVGVDTFTTAHGTYVAVASEKDNGLQIVNVTDPRNPAPAGHLADTEPASDGDDELLLEKSRGVAVFVMGDNTYATVTSFADNGLQIVDVTDPDNPAPAGQLKDTAGGGELLLDRAFGVDIFAVGGNTYAAVASRADNGIQIARLSDITPPAFASAALDEGTGTMTITFSETIDVSETDLSMLYVSDTGGIDEVALTGAAFDSNAADSATISLTLTQAHLNRIIQMGTPQLDIGAAAVYDLFVNHIGAVPDNPITVTADTVRPTFASAALGESTGTMTITFSKTIDVSETDLSMLYVSDTGGIDEVALTGAAFDSNAADSATISLTLTQSHLNQIAPMVTPQLDIKTGAVLDLAGNDIDTASDNPIDITKPEFISARLGSLEDTSSTELEGASGVAVFTVDTNTYAAVASYDDDGLQIVDVSDPDNPAAAGSLGDDTTRLLEGASGVAVFTIGTNTYAAVVSEIDDGLQIVDVSDPDNPAAAGSLGDDTTRLLEGASGVAVFTVDTNTYAAVASFTDNGLQIVDVSDPDNPAAAGSLGDDTTRLLEGAYTADVFTIGTSTYIAVVSEIDDGLQIVDVSDPDNPAAAGSLGDDTTRLLEGASGVAVFTVDTNTYAAVASFTDNGLQIVDVSDPDNPAAAGSLGDDTTRLLEGASGVAVFTVDTNTYVAVASETDNGLQIVDVSDPANPTDAGSLGDTSDLLLDGAYAADVFTIDSNTYAVVASYDDHGIQLVRLGAEAETPNNPPVAPDDAATTPEDTAVIITPAISDPDVADTPRISAVDDPPNGAATHDDTTITYTPDTDYEGTDTFGYTISDGTDTAQGTITVTVTRDNNDPVLGTIGNQAATVGVQLTITPTITDDDTTDTHTYSISRGTLPAAAVFSTSDGTLVWTPVPADAGQTHTVTITVNDGRGGTDSETFDIAVGDAPPTLTLTPVGNIGDNPQLLLDGAHDVDTFQIGTNTYAAVVSESDNGLQIIDVTDPDNPTAAGSLGDTSDELLLVGARGVDIFKIGTNTYAAVASNHDDGIQIVNVTDPDNLTAAGSLKDDGSRLLDGAVSVSVFKIGGSTYAAVASHNEHGIQIVNVTDPDNPAAAGSLGDGAQTILNGPRSVDVFMIGGSTYAAVAAESNSNNGLQIVNVTDPDNPAAAGNLGDDTSTLLLGARGVDTFQIGANTYAAVASNREHGLQIVDVTDPDNPAAAGNLGDNPSTLLRNARGVDTFQIGANTYAAVTSNNEDGLQIVDVTDPDSPTAAGSLGDDGTGGTLLLDGAGSVAVFKIGANTYAAVTSNSDDGLQLVRLDEAAETPNAPPVAPAATATTAEDTPVTITPAISDPDTSDTPTISAVENPPNGTTIHDGTTITYTPDADYEGTDTFGYTVSDGTDTAQGTITVTITRDNNDPVLGTIGDRAATVGVQLTITPAVTDTDTTDTHTYSIARGTLPAAAVFSTSDGTLVWTPVQADAGQTHTVTITVNDGRGGTDSETFDIVVSGTDTAPPAFESATLDEGTGAMTITFDETIDISATNLSLLYVSDVNQADTVPLIGAAFDFGSADVETLSLTLVQAQLDEIAPMGTPQLDITAGAVSDMAGNQIADSPDNPITVTDTTSNSPPLAPAESVTTPEDVPITITPAISDPDTSDTPIISAVGNPPNGAVTHDDTTITYTPDQDFDGTDTFGYTVSDGTDTAQGTITVTVTRDNNNPVLGTIGDQAATVGVQLTITPAVTDADTTDTHTYSITRGTLPAAAVFSTSDGTLVWTPVQADAGQTHTVTITVSDGRGGTDSETFDIVVAGRDITSPAFESATLDEDTGAMTITFDETIDISATNLSLLYVSDVNQADTVSLTGAAFDLGSADVETLSLTLVQAQLDEIVPMGTPQLDITAGAVSDILGNQIADSPDNPITVTDTTSNSPPLAPAESVTTPEDVPITITPAISDPDTSDTPIISAVDNPPNGTATHDDTTITYTPDSDFDGTDTFEYTVSDGTDSVQGTITVTVTRDNNNPVLGTIGDRAATPDTQLVITPAVTDADPTDTHTYSISRGTLPAAATFNTTDGTLVWTPVQADAGQTHTVTITVSDGRGGTDSQTFDIVVADTDPPAIEITPTGNLGDNSTLLLGGPYDVAVFMVGANTYAAVASDDDNALQIVDVTDPSRPTAAGSLGDNSTLKLNSARNVDIFTKDGSTYAAITSFTDNALQIVDVTDPASPAAAGSLGDNSTLHLEGALGVDVFTIGANTYAAVASHYEYALQIVDITNPDSLTAAGNLQDLVSGDTLHLEGAFGVDVFMIGASTYAAVASFDASALQIVDITNPASPTAAGSLRDNNTLELGGAYDVAVFTIGANTYAAVTALNDDGLQIVDITNPARPVAAGNLGDNNTLLLDGAFGVDAFTIGANTYAAVAALNDNGLQIVDVTDPASPAAAGSLGDNNTLLLDGARGVDTFTIGTNTYAAVASDDDNGLQLVRLGADAEAPNSPPVAPDETATTAEDTPVTITPAISDPDASDTPVISAVENPSNGAATHDGTAITYTPDTDYDGTDTFGYTVSDGTDTTRGTITITVTRDNNAPVLGTIGDQAAEPDVQLTITPTVTDADTTDTHTYSITRGTLPAAAAFNTTDGTLVWTPVQADAGQTHTVTIMVDDGRGGTDSQTFDIVVADGDAVTLTPVGSIGNGPQLLLDLPRGVDVFTIGGNTYAAVASSVDDGLQIIDVTDPASPTPVENLKDTDSLLLDGARAVDIFTIGGRTYAAVASTADDGLQIIDVTDPANPTPVGSLGDAVDAETEGAVVGQLLLDGARDVDIFTIGGRTYAAVASSVDNGLQIIDITDPASPAAAGQLEDTEDSDELLLDGAQGVAVFTIGNRTYAAVASFADDGLQIVDVTDPASPVAAGSLEDTGSTELDGASDVAVFTIGGNTYAAVASASGDDGLQIVDVTDPARPVAAGSIADGDSLLLLTARDVAVFTMGGRIYAAVTSFADDGLQIVDVTDPASPVAAGSLEDTGSLRLAGATGVAVFTIGGNTYAAVTAEYDDGLQLVRLEAASGISQFISLVGDNPLIHELGTPYVDPGATTDDGSPVTVDYSQVDVGVHGDYQVIYTAIGGGGSTETAIRIVQVRDTLPPAFASATLDEGTGAMAITFSEAVDISAANLSLLHVSDVNQADAVSLGGAAFDFGSADVETLSLILLRAQLDGIVPMGTPQLDISAGAVSDIFGNRIGGSPDNPITIPGRIQTDDDTDGDTVPPTGRSSGVGGGGGGGGGGRTGIGTTLPGAEAAYIASISWDCAAGFVTIAAGPASDDLAVSVRTTEHSVTRTTGAGQTPEGFAVFKAPMHESESYIGVSAILHSGSSVSSDYESVNVDACAGKRTYDVPVYIPASTVTQTAGGPGDAAVLPPVTPEPPAPMLPEPEPEPPVTPEPPAPMLPEPEPEPPVTPEPSAPVQPEPEPQAASEPGGACLIATAAYGTELAPQVQALREIRDGALLSTGSGSSFVAGFNTVYYSFSPAVADLERQNPAFREAVRIAIYPMISTLSIMSLAEEGSEASVLALGASVIALNIGMYAAAPAAVIVAARRLRG